jgi:hypothetical protein
MSRGIRRYEDKSIEITILDENGLPVTELPAGAYRAILVKHPVDLSSSNKWLFSTTAIVLEAPLVKVPVDDADYDLLPRGYYYLEVKDLTRNLVLFPPFGESGFIDVEEASPPQEEES